MSIVAAVSGNENILGLNSELSCTLVFSFRGPGARFSTVFRGRYLVPDRAKIP